MILKEEQIKKGEDLMNKIQQSLFKYLKIKEKIIKHTTAKVNGLQVECLVCEK